MNYVNQCFLDSDDQAFLAKPSDEENEGDDGPNNEDEEETDIQVLLNLVENLNEDFESYLDGNIVDHEVRLPTGKSQSMKHLAEKYIFETGVLFMRLAL